MKFYKCISTLAISCVLSACGGGSETISSAEALDRLDEIEASLDDFAALSSTVAGDIPTTGSATYTGVVGGAAQQSEFVVGDPITFLGDAQVDVNFATSTLTGTGTNFFGTTGGTDPELVLYSGTLQVTGGSFDNSDPNSVVAQVDGTLTSSEHTIVVGSSASGGFAGSSAEGIGFITPETDAVTVNGTDYLGGVEFIATQ